MKKIMTLVLLSLLAGACSQETKTERLLRESKEAVEETAEDVKEETEDAAEKVEEETEKAKENLEEQTEEKKEGKTKEKLKGLFKKKE